MLISVRRKNYWVTIQNGVLIVVLKPLLSGIKRICVKDDRMVSKTGRHIL